MIIISIRSITTFIFSLELEMEDTFFSWFLITELHTWMMMVRIMAEKDEGMFVRNVVVKAMWDDVNARAKQLGVSNETKRTVVKPSKANRKIGF